MSRLHARVDVVEGELSDPLAGAALGLESRRFVVLTLTDEDGVVGVGEGSPLPDYSPDTTEDAMTELKELLDEPLVVNASLSPRALIDVPEAQLMQSPAARFAFEAALLDWLGKVRERPAHTLLTHGQARSIPIASLVFEADPSRWGARVESLVARGATHLKFKIGAEFDSEVAALLAIRDACPLLRIRLDGNRRIPLAELRRHADALGTLGVEFIEEPVGAAELLDAASLPLPFALDESLRDEALTRALLPNPNLRAIVIKPTVVGGISAAFDLAEIAREHGVEPVLSHTFEGPIGQAACAELALALQTELAAGLGPHPCLALWPKHRIAAISGLGIHAHDSPGLGLEFEDVYDA